MTLTVSSIVLVVLLAYTAITSLSPKPAAWTIANVVWFALCVVLALWNLNVYFVVGLVAAVANVGVSFFVQKTPFVGNVYSYLTVFMHNLLFWPVDSFEKVYTFLKGRV